MGFRELVDSCIRRDPAGWAALIAQHRAQVIRVIAREVGGDDPEAVADLEQEVYSRLLANRCEALRLLRDADGPLAVRAFLCTTAANIARDHRRRLRVRRAVQPVDLSELADELADPSPGPEVRYGLQDRTSRVLQALQQAVREPNAARDSLIFLAHYRDGLTATEIGSMGVGLSPKGVETVLFRVTSRVRELIRIEEMEAP